MPTGFPIAPQQSGTENPTNFPIITCSPTVPAPTDDPTAYPTNIPVNPNTPPAAMVPTGFPIAPQQSGTDSPTNSPIVECSCLPTVSTPTDYPSMNPTVYPMVAPSYL